MEEIAVKSKTTARIFRKAGMYLGLHVLRHEPITQLSYDDRLKILGTIHPKAKGRSLAASPRVPLNLVRDLRKTALKQIGELHEDRVDVGDCSPTSPTDPYVRTLRIRFLKSRVRCVPELGADGANRSKRVTPEYATEFLPVHRPNAVAAIKPLTPSALDFLLKPGQGS